MRLVLRPDLMHVVIRSAAACVSLTPDELATFRALPGTDPRTDE